MSAGKLRPSLFAKTAAHEEPESKKDIDIYINQFLMRDDCRTQRN